MRWERTGPAREREHVHLIAAGQPLLVDVHLWWGWAIVVTNGVAGAWALGAHRNERLRVPALWWLTAVAQLAVLVQVVLGVVLLRGRPTEPYGIHMFYGFVSAFAVAIVYSYRAQLRDQRYLLYGFGGLFLVGMALRAIALQPS